MGYVAIAPVSDGRQRRYRAKNTKLSTLLLMSKVMDCSESRPAGFAAAGPGALCLRVAVTSSERTILGRLLKV